MNELKQEITLLRNSISDTSGNSLQAQQIEVLRSVETELARLRKTKFSVAVETIEQKRKQLENIKIDSGL